MSRSLDIKNYAIALEALSRFPGCEAISNNIRHILQSELEVAHEDMNETLKRRFDTFPKTDNIPDEDSPF